MKRYKRFLAEIVLVEDGIPITAHCPNPGAMMGLAESGSKVWVSQVPPYQKRALRYTWELIETDNTLVGINTNHPNRIIHGALLQRVFPEFSSYSGIKPEVKWGDSRFDFQLIGENKRPCYIEVKNVHLKRGVKAEFPDSITARGAKHLQRLTTLQEQGMRTALIYVIQRDDCQEFSLAADIDPLYAEMAEKAQGVGVEIFAYPCRMSLDSITLLAHKPFKI